ncbi:hypothetical protein GCM10009616_03060 [Microlunatus lacustris]
MLVLVLVGLGLDGLVLVVDQELQRGGRLGEQTDGLGPPHTDRVAITLDSEDVGEPVDGGHEPAGVPGGCPGHDGLQPVLAGVDGHIPFGARALRTLGRQGGIGFEDSGGENPLESSPRQHPHPVGHRGVHQTGCLQRQRVGGLSHGPGLPRPDVTAADPAPQPRQPAPDVQGVRDQPLRARRADTLQRAQLVDRVLRHLRRPLATPGAGPLDQGLVVRRRGIDPVGVSPGRGQQQDLALALPQLGLVRVDPRGQFRTGPRVAR